MRTVFWDYDRGVMKMIDQRLLPWEVSVPDYETYQEVAAAIRDMVVRGAPAIGAAAAFGMVLAARQSRATDRLTLLRHLEEAGRDLEAIGLAVATKVFATEQAARIVDTGMQVIGGGAFFKRNPLERLYRDVRAGKFHPPSHYDALESVGKAYLGIERGPQRFL